MYTSDPTDPPSVNVPNLVKAIKQPNFLPGFVFLIRAFALVGTLAFHKILHLPNLNEFFLTSNHIDFTVLSVSGMEYSCAVILALRAAMFDANTLAKHPVTLQQCELLFSHVFTIWDAVNAWVADPNGEDFGNQFSLLSTPNEKDLVMQYINHIHSFPTTYSTAPVTYTSLHQSVPLPHGAILPSHYHLEVMFHAENILQLFSTTILMDMPPDQSDILGGKLLYTTPLISLLNTIFDGSFTEPKILGAFLSFLARLMEDRGSCARILPHSLQFPAVLGRLAKYALPQSISPHNPLHSLILSKSKSSSSTWYFLKRILRCCNELAPHDATVTKGLLPTMTFITSAVTSALQLNAMYYYLFLTHAPPPKPKNFSFSFNNNKDEDIIEDETITITLNNAPLHITLRSFSKIQDPPPTITNNHDCTTDQHVGCTICEHPTAVSHVICYDILPGLLRESNIFYEIVLEYLYTLKRIVFLVQSDWETHHDLSQLIRAQFGTFSHSWASFLSITQMSIALLAKQTPAHASVYIKSYNDYIARLQLSLADTIRLFIGNFKSTLSLQPFFNYAATIDFVPVIENLISSKNNLLTTVVANAETKSTQFSFSPINTKSLPTLPSETIKLVNDTTYTHITTTITCLTAFRSLLAAPKNAEYLAHNTALFNVLSQFITEFYMIRENFITQLPYHTSAHSTVNLNANLAEKNITIFPQSYITAQAKHLALANEDIRVLTRFSDQLVPESCSRLVSRALTPLISTELLDSFHPQNNTPLTLSTLPSNRAFSSVSPFLHIPGNYAVVSADSCIILSEIFSLWFKSIPVPPVTTTTTPTHYPASSFVPMALTLSTHFARIISYLTSMVSYIPFQDTDERSMYPTIFSKHLVMKGTAQPGSPIRYVLKDDSISSYLFPLQYLQSLYNIMSYGGAVNNYHFIQNVIPVAYRAPMVKGYVEAIMLVIQGLCYSNAHLVSLHNKERVAALTASTFMTEVKNTRMPANRFLSASHLITDWNVVKTAAEQTHTLENVWELSHRAALIPDCFHNVRTSLTPFIQYAPRPWVSTKKTVVSKTSSFEYVYTSSQNDLYNANRIEKQDFSLDMHAAMTEIAISYLIDMILLGGDLSDLAFAPHSLESLPPPPPTQQPQLDDTPLSFISNISLAVHSTPRETQNAILSHQNTTGFGAYLDFSQPSETIDELATLSNVNPYQIVANSYNLHDLSSPPPTQDIEPFPLTPADALQMNLPPECFPSKNPAIDHFVIKRLNTSHTRLQPVNIEYLMMYFAEHPIRDQFPPQINRA